MTSDVLTHLPQEIAYLGAPARKYGIYQLDDEVDDFLSVATDTQMNELASIAERVRSHRHFDLVNSWLDEYDMLEHEGASELYFLFGVLDAADLAFDAD